MSITLLDIVAIIGLPVIGEELPSLYDKKVSLVNFKFSNKESPYSNFAVANMSDRSAVIGDKHHAFLLAWFCQFLVCTNSITMVNAYS